MNLRLGSLFDGIGGFPLAGLRHGFTPVWASEIEPFPIRVTQHHFPSMKHLGDITKINGAEIEPVDVITFGSPCTRLSVAGRHDGFDITFECQGTEEEPHIIYTNKIRATDKYQYIYKDYCPICGKELIETNESALFFHAIRIIQEMRGATNGTYPRFVVWENVPGAFSSNGGQDFRAVLESFTNTTIPMPISGGWADAGMVGTNSIDLAWRVLDARYWGVPQRRRRIFLVADFGGERAGEILFVEESLRGNSAESRKAREEAARHVGSGIKAAGFKYGNSASARSIGWELEKSPTLCGGEGGNQKPCVAQCVTTGTGRRYDPETETLVVEPRSQDGVCRIHHGVVPTLNTAQEGQRQPCVLAFNGRQDPVSGNITGSLDACSPQAQCVAYPEPANTLLGKANLSYRGDSDTVVTVDCRNLYENQELSGTIQAKEGGGYSLNYQNPVRIGYRVRRLIPLECERLQGFPDNWTDIPGASDAARYKAIGNSVAIVCVEFLMQGIARVLKKGGA